MPKMRELFLKEGKLLLNRCWNIYISTCSIVPEEVVNDLRRFGLESKNDEKVGNSFQGEDEYF